MVKEEKPIREGEMTIKMHYGTSGLSISTYDYLKTATSEDIKSTTSSLKKKSKRVGFNSVPLKNTM